MNTESRYHPVSQWLHWIVAGLIILQFVLAKLADIADDDGSAIRELALLANHKSVGITILMLVIARLIWRWMNPPPPLPASVVPWQATLSSVGHWTLYGLILLLPISGWLMSSASAYSVSWFNLFQLPDFIAPNPDLKEIFEDIHELLSKELLVVAIGHILAALKHHFIDKDGVLLRMFTKVTAAAAVVIVVLGYVWLGTAGKASTTQSVAETAANPAATTEVVIAVSDLETWVINTDDSFIHFTGDQAGADFDGVWKTWTADIRFAGDALASSSFDVTVRTTDVETEDEDRDTTLMDPEWFDPKTFPEAYYRATSFVANDDGSFVANGQLVIKDNAVPLALSFTVESDGANRLLQGSAELLRLDHAVGVGEWEDTTWVSNEVTVSVRVAATVTN